MDANGDVALPSAPLGEECSGLRITGNSAATSSTDPLWYNTTNQGSETDACASLLPSTDVQQAVCHSNSSGRRPRVSDRPGPRSTWRTVRRAGSAVICLEAVSALHRKDKDQKRAKTPAQVFSGKGKDTSPAEEAHGPAAELTAKAAALSFGAGGDVTREKNSEGKEPPNSGKATTAAEVSGASAQKYQPRPLSEDKKAKPAVDAAKSIGDGTDRQRRNYGKKGKKSAKTASPASKTLDKTAAAGRSQRVIKATSSKDAESSAGVTGGGIIDDAASLAEFADGEVATVTDAATAMKMKMLRRSELAHPSLLETMRAWGNQVLDGCNTVRHRIAGFFWSSSSTEVRDADSSPLDTDSMWLQRDQDPQDLSLLQLEIEEFLSEEVAVAPTEACKGVVTGGFVPVGLNDQEPVAAGAQRSLFYCECPAWQFPATAEGDLSSKHCQLYETRKVDNGGAQNAGTIIVRATQVEPVAKGRASSRKWFCKKMRSKVVKGRDILKEDNKNECAAATLFVKAWNQNMMEYPGVSAVGTPFCIDHLSRVIDVTRPRTLCADVMSPVDNGMLAEALVSTGVALQKAVTKGTLEQSTTLTNVVWWTWQSLCTLRAKNIFHRDVKPENFLALSKGSNQWILADMGLACSVGESEPPVGVQKCGGTGWAGTLYFMSPDHFFPEGSSWPRDGDSFSWVVMTTDGAMTECSGLGGHGAGRKSAIEMLLGFAGDLTRTKLVYLLQNKKTCSSRSILSQLVAAKKEGMSPNALGNMLLKWMSNPSQIEKPATSTQSRDRRARQDKRRMDTSMAAIEMQYSRSSDIQSRCVAANFALQNTQLKPLPSVSGEDRSEVPAIELMAKVLTAYDWERLSDPQKYKEVCAR
ncbi:unnamed protein product [Amoebophrya sp. A25]|nr:unnamed protein product [Amoebophrya sp. A25]|eukprot:GSA25T00026747001.1